MDFKKFHLNAAVDEGVTSAGYVTPTPIQTQAIPAVMQGRDVMGLAQTGTGKTAAFALPILHRLMQGGRRDCCCLSRSSARPYRASDHQPVPAGSSGSR